MPITIRPTRCGLDIDKNEAKEMLAEGIERLSDLQERLYADDRWSVLLVLQAMDAAGKDSAIKHVMTGINPQGCEVHARSSAERGGTRSRFPLARLARRLPERGRIGIFNRSYYEEVLVVRVHPEFLAEQTTAGRRHSIIKLWQHRFDDIRNFERHLARKRHVRAQVLPQCLAESSASAFSTASTTGQELEVLHADVSERKRWDDYMAAYDEMIRDTSRPEAPWYVVPADNNGSRGWWWRPQWSKRGRAGSGVPQGRRRMLKELQQAKKALEAEKP